MVKAQSRVRYARNVKEVARVLGFSPNRRSIREEIAVWMDREDWPAKSSKGWTHDDLLAWQQKTAPEFATRKALSIILDPERDVKATDLKIAQSMVVKSPGTEAAGEQWPSTVGGMDRLGALIAKRFNIQCGRQYIDKWKKFQGVGRDCRVPFPAPHESGRYNVAECFAWVERFVMPNRHGNGDTPDMFGASALVKNRIDEKRLELLDLEVGAEKGRLIDRRVAELSAIGVIQQLQNVVTAQDEQEAPRFCREVLRSLGVGDLIIAEFERRYLEFAKGITDRRVELFHSRMDGVLADESGKVGE